MDNKILIIIEKIVVYIFCLLSLLIIIATIIDLVTYFKGSYNLHFDFKDTFKIGSTANYFFNGFIVIIVSIIVLGLSLWRLFKPSKFFRIFVISMYLILLIGFSIIYYHSYLNGFEHTW